MEHIKGIQVPGWILEKFGKKLLENTLPLLEIRLRLSGHGMMVEVGANGLVAKKINEIAGEGWLENFGAEVGNAMDHSKELEEVLEKRFVELSTAITANKDKWDKN